MNGYIEQLPGGVKLEMMEVPGGTFIMGSPDYEVARDKNEGPQHKVMVGDFYIGRYEMTQGQWKAVMGSLPPRLGDLGAEFKRDDLPVMGVSWDEAKEFIRKLNKLAGGDYRLPSEAEWEYAARAGSQEAFSFGPTITPELVNYDCDYNDPYKTAAECQKPLNLVSPPVRVGSCPANAFGLFDMHGNVYEWCEDDWHDNYNGAPADGRAWVNMSSRAPTVVVRGSRWFGYARYHRSAARSSGAPGGADHDLDIGFRLARTAK